MADESLRAIFNEALELADPAERERFLQEACGADADLRERVEKLLRAHDDAGGFLSEPSKTPASSRARTVFIPPTEKPGDMIGRYKLLQQIGEGGCGVVYMAEQQEPVRRRVALKVIKLGMDTRQVIARFEAERQVLAMMDHSNIARVLDAGVTESGRPFFVMELVRGVKITEFCDQQKLSTQKRLELFVQVCSAVQHAHQKGIIHRDLKPSNILVTMVDGSAVPKVIDFGIAKATNNQPLTDKTVFTAFEQFIGTPAYMSPEQAQMSGVDIDTRTDIYSLGVVLYELLTGATPFDAGQLLKAGLDEIRRIVREEEPAKPSTRLQTMAQGDLTTVAAARHTEAPKLIHLVRGDLDWIAMKCLEKDRNRRYETANGLAMDIQRHLQNEPVVARPPSNLYRFQKLVRRNKLAFGAAAAVLLALLAGIAASTWQAIRATRAEREQTRLRQEAETANQKEKVSRQKAEKQQALAEERSQALARNLYASHMNVAFKAWEEGDVARVLALLDEHRPKAGEEDLRGFEWFYLWRLCHTEQTTLFAHNAHVRCVTFSPDGRMLATVGDDSLARIWDAQTGQELLTLKGHTNWITSAAFSPDGKTLATGSGDQTVRLWDAVTGAELGVLRGHTQVVTAVAFTPDGKMLASATGRKVPGDDATQVTRFVDYKSMPAEVKLWDAEKRTEIRTLNCHRRSILSLAISPDGQTLATGSADATVRLWEIATGNMKTNIAIGAAVFAVAFSPDGLTLATGGGDPNSKETVLQQWDVSTAKAKMVFEGHDGPVASLAFAPDGKTLASGGMDHIVKFWQVSNGKELRSLKGHTSAVWSLAYDHSGDRLATGSWDNSVKLWNANGRQGLETLPISPFSFSFSPDGKLLATGRHEGVEIFEVGTAKPPFFITEGSLHDGRVIFSPDGTLLACTTFDGRLMLWQTSDWRQLLALKGQMGEIWSVAFSPDSLTLAIGSQDRTVRLWDVRERRERAVAHAHTSMVSSLAFTPDGKTLVAGSFNEIVFLDAFTGEVRKEFEECGRRLAISPDGRFMAVLRRSEMQIEMLELATMQSKWRTKAHQDVI